MKRSLLLLLTLFFAIYGKASITVGDNQVWWGYFNAANASSLSYGGYIGNSSACTIDAAIKIPATEDMVNAIHKLDYISGGDFPAITVLVKDIDEYEVGQMSNFKHLELFLGNGLEAIEWNTHQDFEEMNDDALLGVPKTFVGTLESGFLRKKFIKKISIMN